MGATFKALFATLRGNLAYKQTHAKLELTRQLQDRMRQQGMSADDLARKSGKSASCVARVLRSEHNCGIDTLVALADALHTRVEIRLVAANDGTADTDAASADGQALSETA